MGTLTCLGVRPALLATKASASPGRGAPVVQPAVVAGDSNGGVWVLRRTPSTDAYTVTHALPRWVEGADTAAHGAVTALTWRDGVLVGAAADGAVAGWQLSDGASCEGRLRLRPSTCALRLCVCVCLCVHPPPYAVGVTAFPPPPHSDPPPPPTPVHRALPGQPLRAGTSHCEAPSPWTPPWQP